MIKPMLAELGSVETLKKREYLFEPKLDGIRAILKINTKFELFNRHGKEITSNYTDLNLKNIFKKPCIVDGELIIYDEKGNPDFSEMQKRHLGKKNVTPTYVIFDILELNNKSLISLPLEKRKQLLEGNIKPNNQVQLMIYTKQGTKLWNLIKKRNIEGIIAKKLGSQYIQNRSSLWLKIKTTKTLDCIIVGYSKRKRSFLLGLYDKQLIFIGKVGSGLTDQEFNDIIKELKPVPKTIKDLPNYTQQVQPKLVCEIENLNVTKDQKLRAPVFLHLRSDKKPKECTINQLKNETK